MEELSNDELALVAGGGFMDFMHRAYVGVLSYPTAALGGWKLADQMYGKSATWGDRFRSMRAIKSVVVASGKVPAWAPKLF